jgi:malate synthase
MERMGSLRVDGELLRFIAEEALPGTGVSAETFWSGAEAIIHEFSPVIRTLLEQRNDLQRQIDDWHRAHPGPILDSVAYERKLRDIGYLLEEPADLEITTENVDTEIARQAGPQLVVPLTNARFAVNAANARWGSFYDHCRQGIARYCIPARHRVARWLRPLCGCRSGARRHPR